MNVEHAGAQPIALTLVDSFNVESTPEFMVPLRVHDGATLDKVVFSFRVPEVRDAAPESMPRFRVVRRDVNGIVEPLKSTEAGDGFASPDNPGSAEAWFASGVAQSFEYACDQRNAVDVSKYAYFAHVIEESGAQKAPERVRVYNATNVATASTGDVDDLMPDGPRRGKAVFDTIDTGYASTVPFIYKDATYPPTPNAVHGLYTSGANNVTNWPRFAGFDTSEALTEAAGMLFHLDGGFTQSFTIWQLNVSLPCKLGQTPISFDRPVARGNVYLPVEAHFSGITSTRWQ